MPGLRAISIFAVAAACLLRLEEAAPASPTEDRLIVETRALLRVVRDQTIKPWRCELSDEWDKTPIPIEIAKKHFGVNLWAALAGDYKYSYGEFRDVRKILDPEGSNPESFCTEMERSEYRKTIQESEDHASFGRSTYSFPVFDRRFRKAAIVVGHFFDRFEKTPDGKLKHFGIGNEKIFVFAKEKGMWRQIEEIAIGMT